jgi:hypothetical protein
MIGQSEGAPGVVVNSEKRFGLFLREAMELPRRRNHPGGWKTHDHDGAACGYRVDIENAAVELNETLSNRQAQPDP